MPANAAPTAASAIAQSPSQVPRAVSTAGMPATVASNAKMA